ncbi:MAG: transglutaminase-like domain-containing protein [Thermoguttaceae bacterium]|jgi:hypothetical protein
MDRRSFLQWGLGAAASASVVKVLRAEEPAATPSEIAFPPPVASVIPVVGDGKYIWNKPPEGETGYLEPRPFEAMVGIELVGRGNGTDLRAATPAPVQCPEQKIVKEDIETHGCEAEVRQLGPFARQLFLRAPSIASGQVISAKVHCQLTLYKQFENYHRDQFPERQAIPTAVQKAYLGDSPGIESRAPEVRQLLAKLTSGKEHPWDLAKKFAQWIVRSIRPQIGPYIGVSKALQGHAGDCAEMSAIFVALCRAAGIPARLVWVPNHNWAEFYLADAKGAEHWIPVHTACYFWFGWTGAHELVIQKGDRIRFPEKNRNYRLLEDWLQWGGRKPESHYLGDLAPQPGKSGEPAGPGARRKSPTGEWVVVGKDPLDRYTRR